MEDNKKQEVIELALKIFKRKLGFTFRADVEPDVIEKLVKSEPFQYYIEEAENQLEKRGKALSNNKQYRVIEVPADGKRGVAGGAYVLCFVYSKYKGNFVVKGYMREVEEYLKKNYTHYFCNFSLLWMGGHRDIWKFWKKSIGIFEPSNYKKGVEKENLKFKVRPYLDWDAEDDVREKTKEQELVFKRMPKRWIPEFDKL